MSHSEHPHREVGSAADTDTLDARTEPSHAPQHVGEAAELLVALFGALSHQDQVDLARLLEHVALVPEPWQRREELLGPLCDLVASRQDFASSGAYDEHIAACKAQGRVIASREQLTNHFGSWPAAVFEAVRLARHGGAGRAKSVLPSEHHGLPPGIYSPLAGERDPGPGQPARWRDAVARAMLRGKDVFGYMPTLREYLEWARAERLMAQVARRPMPVLPTEKVLNHSIGGYYNATEYALRHEDRLRSHPPGAHVVLAPIRETPAASTAKRRKRNRNTRRRTDAALTADPTKD